jgi:hypothetical protein
MSQLKADELSRNLTALMSMRLMQAYVTLAFSFFEYPWDRCSEKCEHVLITPNGVTEQ